MTKLHRLRTPLFRAFTEKRYALDFVRGKFKFSELSRYRNIEDASRHDRSEGHAHFLDSVNHQWDTQLGGAIYVLCFSCPNIDSNFLREKMGRFVVRVADPLALARDVQQYMDRCGIRSFNGVHGRPVEYSRGQTIDRAMDPSQRAILSVTQKAPSYCQEHEYRLFTILNQHPGAPVADFLNVDLGFPLTYAEVLAE